MHLTGLAEQGVYASLVIKNTEDRYAPDQTQLANSNLVVAYDKSQNLSKIDPMTFRITNLPRLLTSVPLTSIFSYIMYIDPSGPDPRFVPVMNDIETQQQAFPTSNELTPLIVENPASAKIPIFETFPTPKESRPPQTSTKTSIF